MAYESDRDKPFYELGYATPEEAEDYHAERFARQKLPVPKRKFRSGHIRDYESDRDHDLLPMNMDEVREARNQPRSEGAAAAARAALREVQNRDIDDIAAGDEKLAAALRRVRDERRSHHQDTA